MKLTKSQLRQIIKEELENIAEIETADAAPQSEEGGGGGNTDPQKIINKYPKAFEAMQQLINTPKEFVELLKIVIGSAPNIKDQHKLLAIRAVLKDQGS